MCIPLSCPSRYLYDLKLVSFVLYGIPNVICLVIREHLLSVTVHPVNTFSNNNPTFTSVGSLNTNNILFCKDETAGIHSNMKA